MAEAAQRFESEYDSRQYEKKIAALINKLQKRLKSEDPNTLKAWSDALGKLSEGDHYLLLLARLNVESSHRPPYDFLKLCVTALLIVVAGVGLMRLLPEQATGTFAREKSAFIMSRIAIIGLVNAAITVDGWTLTNGHQYDQFLVPRAQRSGQENANQRCHGLLKKAPADSGQPAN